MLQRMQVGRLQKAIEDAGKALDKAHKDVGRLVKRTTDDVDRFVDKRMSTRRSGSCRTPSVACSTPESSSPTTSLQTKWRASKQPEQEIAFLWRDVRKFF